MGRSYLWAVALVLALFGASRAYAQPLSTPPIHAGKTVDAVEFSLAGASGDTMRVRGSDHDALTGAVTLSAHREGYGYDNGLVVRVDNAMRLGGGSAGVEGDFRQAIAGGYRFAVTPKQGPIVRAGVDGFLEGNRYLWHAALEVPKVFLGYQYLSGTRLAEVGPTAGYVLLGRYRAGIDSGRNLENSFDWGGMAALLLPPVRVAVALSRVETGAAPMYTFDASLCGVRRVGACVEARYLAGQVFEAGGVTTTARTWLVSLTLGLGRLGVPLL